MIALRDGGAAFTCSEPLTGKLGGMFFGRWRRRDPLLVAWRESALTLGLESVEDGPSRIGELLDLTDVLEVGEVYRVAQAGELEAYVFYYRRGSSIPGRGIEVVTGCLLISPGVITPVSWRASRRLHELIASLQASATGGEVLSLADAPEFSERVTVVARDSARIESLLRSPVRHVLERALLRNEPPPVITVGEKRILFSLTSPTVAHDRLEFLLSDAMSLHAALVST